MRTEREIFLDEEVLRIQNEVRRYQDEQRVHDGNVNDKVQRGDGASADSDSVPAESRSNFVQNASSIAQRK